MAVTAFGALSAAQKKVWATEITIAGRDQNFWMSNGFVGKNTADMTRPVQRITELTEMEGGLSAVMQLVAELQSDGVVGDNLLTNNEESLINDTVEIRLDQIRNGVRSRGRMAEQATVLRFRTIAKDKLAYWLANSIDELMFLVAAGRSFTLHSNGAPRVNSQFPQLTFSQDVVAASSARILFQGTNTSESTFTTADTMDWSFIVRAIAYAKRKRIKPIRAGGKPYYALVLTTEQLRDLKLDPTYQTVVSRGGARGPDNPLFNNAVAVIDGAVIFDHQKTWNTLGAGSGSKWGAGGTVDGAQGLLMGAQAIGLATVGAVDYEEADQNDYRNRPGIAYGRKLGLLKPQFVSIYDSMTKQDFGIVSLKTAAGATQ